jgi:DNA-binding NarL/FixJ family response regulator
MRSHGVKGIPTAPRASTKANPAGLTDRETEVLALLAQGLSNAAIAGRLHRSTRTVEHHVATLTGKLGADSRQSAVAIARKRGLLAD